MKFIRLLALFLLGLGVFPLLMPGPAWALRHKITVDADMARIGVVVPALAHGDLLGLARVRGAIEAEAAKHVEESPKLALLLDYAEAQYAAADYAFWPRALTDEYHPYHVAVHAYLAADKAMLDLMATLPAAKDTAYALDNALTMAIIAEGYMPGICSASGIVFNTNELIRPSRAELLEYAPYRTLAFWAIMALLATSSLGFSLFMTRRALRRYPDRYAWGRTSLS